MRIARSTFLTTGALAVAAVAISPGNIFAAAKKPEYLGLQLYSVREDMKKDPAGTLLALSRMGYRYVEHANYIDRTFYGYSAAEFRKRLDDLGLTMRSGHTVMNSAHWDAAANDFTDAWKHTIEDAVVLGQRYVISPWLEDAWRKTPDDLKRAMELFNKSGELCKKSGLKFGYHNHNFEFSTMVGGKKLYDIILTETDPSLVAQQIDIGNMYGAGGRADAVIRQYPGRFELMHVKDEIKSATPEMDDPYESTVLGKGIIGTRAITDLARRSGGTTDFIIEQESYQGKTPVDCAKEDLVVMKAWGY